MRQSNNTTIGVQIKSSPSDDTNLAGGSGCEVLEDPVERQWITESCDGQVSGSYVPFITDGFVSLVGSTDRRPIKILRDTGATESFVVESALPFSVQSNTGKNVLIRGIGMQTMSVPLHRIALSSDLVQGDVIVGVRLALPVPGVQMILGNNLAGDRVWLSGPVTPIVSNEPAEATKRHECVEEFPEVFTACAVTRARSLAESAKPAIPSLPNLPQSLSHNEVVLAQKDDEGLVELYARAVTTETLQSDQGGYFIVDGLLVRNFVHNELNETWLQIIIPKKYRGLVLKTAHGDVAGHFGVRKTYNSVVRHFYWPRMKKMLPGS